MDKRHIAHVNANRINAIDENNKGVVEKNREKQRVESYSGALRGFTEQIKNSRMIPERRVFI